MLRLEIIYRELRKTKPQPHGKGMINFGLLAEDLNSWFDIFLFYFIFLHFSAKRRILKSLI